MTALKMKTSRSKCVTMTLCVTLLSPVIYWYATEPYVTNVVLTNGNARNGNKDEGGDGKEDACQFPDFDPFHPHAMKYFKQYPTTSCPNGMPTVTFFNGEEVKVNKTKKVTAFGKDARLDCWYRNLTHHSRSNYVYGAWHGPFYDAMKVEGHPDFVEVKCLDQGQIVSRTHHYITRDEERRKAGVPPQRRKEFNPASLNVMMLCMDSMARHLFARAMPKTRKYLLETLGAVELQKYNKVGGNTFPNLLALAAGIFETDIKEWTKAANMDELPFLWKDYKAAGYQTQYATDRADFDDFINPPTDSFNPPLSKAMMKGKIDFNNNCFEDQIEVPYWLNFVKEFAKESLFTTGRFYSFTMMNRPTHDFPNQASAVDEHYYNFMKEIFEGGILNNTFLAFFGDHGPRMSGYRRTYYGSVEERAALMTIYVPKWFRHKYPDHYKNLLYNKDRLTTNFDVHETTRNLLTLETGGRLVTEYSKTTKVNDDKGAYKIRSSKTGKQRAFSLFTRIPRDRTCSDAAIIPHRCMCHGGVAVIDPIIMKEIGNQVIKDLNLLLEPKSDLCEKLTLGSVTSLTLLTGQVGRTSVYRIMLTSGPAGAVLEATVQYTVTLYFFTSIKTLGIPSRLDFYRGQSDCVHQEPTLKMFCYCKSNNKSNSSNLLPTKNNE